MCGICGIVQPQGVPPLSSSILQEMARTMKHRGPDDEGYHQEDQAGLGFRRLSIIDLAGGHQPMSNEDDSLWIVFNGEIYNFQELRQELEATGRHTFKTRSDTEIILHLYEEHGEACVQKLRGMFAFAIWNRKKRELFAARDRFGKKPFFYFLSSKGELIFASELNALRRHPDCPSAIDAHSIHLYLSLQYIPSPRSIYAGVFKLPPAHSLVWNEKFGVRVKRYWDIRYEPKESLTYEQARERLRHRLTESVRLRMIADVPLGAFLSGGMDSSIIVALMAKESTRPIQTFTIGFEEQEYSELPFARAVAEKYKTSHHEFVVKPELIDILPKLAWHYSEPYADSSALPSYYLTQQTRRHVTVALNGDGGDEVFAGYLRYRAMWAMQVWNKLPQGLRKSFASLGSVAPSSAAPIGWSARIRRLLEIGALAPTDQYLRTLDYFQTSELSELWTGPYRQLLAAAGTSSQALFEATLQEYNPKELIDRLMYLDLHHYLPDDLMVKMDIASMANSLETRSPFLDHILVEDVARWPSSWKYSPPNNSKKILKDTFAIDLPPQIQNRAKKGFGVPISQWFRGPLKSYVRDILLSSEAQSRGYFRPDVVTRYVDEHQSGRKDRGYQLWSLLMLELWHREASRP